ncbi:MAG: hypothetical protein H6733_14050 [Alphaproteobacteria bacterium]|nr:hypothetical protein [Alphaproteobacteria bacterium]
MPGLGEILIIGLVALFFGGGSTVAWMARLRAKAMSQATDAMRAEADKVIPAELKRAADVMGKARRGDVMGVLDATRAPQAGVDGSGEDPDDAPRR